MRLRWDRDTGMLLLAVWLILWGLSGLLPLGIPFFGTLLALLAIVTGVLLFVGRR